MEGIFDDISVNHLLVCVLHFQNIIFHLVFENFIKKIQTLGVADCLSKFVSILATAV
jgi:hypothetical protein